MVSPPLSPLSLVQSDCSPACLLLDDLTSVFRRHVILPPRRRRDPGPFGSLHTYAYELRDVSRLHRHRITGQRLRENNAHQCPDGTHQSAQWWRRTSVTSAFFRVIQETRPTLLIDEADTFLQGNDELRGILNSGYKQQGSIRVAGVRNEAGCTGNAGMEKNR